MYTKKEKEGIKIKKLVIAVLLFSMCFMGMPMLNAQALEDEKIESEETEKVKFVTEDGSIIEKNVTDGTVDVEDDNLETQGLARSVKDVKVVNFNYNSTDSPTTSFTDIKTGKDGYVSKRYGADAAYLGTFGNKVRFMISGVIGEVDSNEVQVVSSGEVHVSYYLNSSGVLYHYIATNLNEAPSVANKVGDAPSFMKQGVRYYSYDGHYFYENYYTMLNDYQNTNRNHASNSNSPYYNYFQYLPMRSKSNYSADQINSYISNHSIFDSSSKLKDTGSSFVNYQNKYGVNALIAFSHAILESNYGKSSIAQNNNNLFGLKATDSNPQGATGYSSVDVCIKDYMEGWMSKGYLRVSDWRYNGGFLGNKASGIFYKYSSDPYEGEKVAGICKTIDDYLGKQDKGFYIIGVKDSTNMSYNSVSVKKEANSSSSTIYNTKTNPCYSFILKGLNNNNGYYLINSESVLNSSRSSIDSSTGIYDFSTMYGYIPVNSVSIIDSGTKYNIAYQTHVQTYGWGGVVGDGMSSGTIGQSKRLESIRLILQNQPYSGSIQYRTHIQTYGWENDWKSNGDMSGTSGQSKRLEAIQIRLTDEMEKHYDVYYRVHAQQFGWLDWAKNGDSAGTAGFSYRLEAIEVKLVEKGKAAPGTTSTPFKTAQISYQTHIQTYGWQDRKFDGKTAGTTGVSKRLEGIKVELRNQSYTGSVQYRTYIQTYGWENGWKSNDTMSGTSGQSKRLEAIQIRLTGEMANHYDVYYRVHAQQFGWLGWAKNGESAGTAGYSYRLEGIEVRLVPKGASAPKSTTNSFHQK